MRLTHFSDEIDVAFPFLDVWRTLRRNSVSRMSSISLGRIKNRRQETNFQLIFPILQKVSNREILHENNREGQISRKMAGAAHLQRTYISTKHVVRAANVDPVEPDRRYRVNAIKNQKNLIFGSFGEE